MRKTCYQNLKSHMLANGLHICCKYGSTLKLILSDNFFRNLEALWKYLLWDFLKAKTKSRRVIAVPLVINILRSYYRVSKQRCVRLIVSTYRSITIAGSQYESTVTQPVRGSIMPACVVNTWHLAEKSNLFLTVPGLVSCVKCVWLRVVKVGVMLRGLIAWGAEDDGVALSSKQS